MQLRRDKPYLLTEIIRHLFVYSKTHKVRNTKLTYVFSAVRDSVSMKCSERTIRLNLSFAVENKSSHTVAKKVLKPRSQGFHA